MRSWKHRVILKIKHRLNGFGIQSSVSECLIIEFEKIREIVSDWQNVEFQNYTKSGFPIWQVSLEEYLEEYLYTSKYGRPAEQIWT
jgi:hypothetical protein